MGVISCGAIQYLMNEITTLNSELTKLKKQDLINDNDQKLLDNKIEQKISIKIFSLTKKYKRTNNILFLFL